MPLYGQFSWHYFITFTQVRILANIKLKIKPIARKYGLDFLLAGGIALVVVSLFLKVKAGPITLLDIVIIGICFMLLLLGWLKLQEPEYSLLISIRGLIYHHRYGHLKLVREVIDEIGPATMTRENVINELPYVGIRVKAVEHIMDSMPVRLMLKLMMEQRPLLVEGIKSRWPTGGVPDGWLVEDTLYSKSNNCQYKGVMAMFAHRLEHNFELFGYHILIPHNALDRPPEQFINFLQHWLRQPQQTLEKCCNIKDSEQ